MRRIMLLVLLALVLPTAALANSNVLLTTHPVPEPSVLEGLLFGSGLLGLAGTVIRKLKRGK